MAIVFSSKGNNKLTGLELPEKKARILGLTDSLRDVAHEIDYAVLDIDGEQFKKFCDAHIMIEAAGGLVVNAQGKLLAIHRLDTWDLPKGKIESGESPEECALREVAEETGIKNVKIVKSLDSTYHTYILGKKFILKKTFWFEMMVDGEPELTPQTEEAITEAKWATRKEVKEMIEETYPSLRPLFNAYLLGHK